ncbi:MAG: DNA polymerase III subunit gamma/tau [Deltaproteobacteria bacterium]|nr:DNA polymerase III subunit gamma/tau [Deltaproteobacteria bacterium]
MAYTVLARQWRPQRFSELIGQEHVADTLKNAICNHRIHHAYLFSGPRGVGKTSAARILAKVLNCEQPGAPLPDPCNQCASCEEITNGIAGDVIEIDGASNTGVEDIRELKENVRYLPARSRYKIFIIDEVHMLSKNAFNALLKVLEEPPPHVKFIFATTEIQKIPITILSRCQRFDFRRIPLAKIVEQLTAIAQHEQISISPASLRLVARQADGCMRDALSTLDQVFAYGGSEISDDDVVSLLGVTDRALLLETASALLYKDPRLLLEKTNQANEKGVSLRHFCKELIETFRALIWLKIAPGEESDAVEENGETGEKLRALAENATHEDLIRDMSLLLRLERELSGASFPALALEAGLLRICHFPQALPLAELLARLTALEERLNATSASGADWGGTRASMPHAPVPKPVSNAVPVPESRPVEEKHVPDRLASIPPAKREEDKPPVSSPAAVPPAENVEENTPDEPAGPASWENFLAQLRFEQPLLAAQLGEARLLSEITSAQLKIGFPKEIYGLRDKASRTRLEELLGRYFQRAITVVPVILEDDAPSQETGAKASPAAESVLEARKNIARHLAVTSVLNFFNGTLERVEPLPSKEKG